MSLYFYLVILFNRCCQGVLLPTAERTGMLDPPGLPTSSLLPNALSSRSILSVFMAPVKCPQEKVTSPRSESEGPVRVEVGSRRVRMERQASQPWQATRSSTRAGQSVRSPREIGEEVGSPVGHPSPGSLRLLAEDSPGPREGGGWLGLGSRACL